MSDLAPCDPLHLGDLKARTQIAADSCRFTPLAAADLPGSVKKMDGKFNLLVRFTQGMDGNGWVAGGCWDDY